MKLFFSVFHVIWYSHVFGMFTAEAVVRFCDVNIRPVTNNVDICLLLRNCGRGNMKSMRDDFCQNLSDGSSVTCHVFNERRYEDGKRRRGSLFWYFVSGYSYMYVFFLEGCMHARFTVTISSVEPNTSQFDWFAAFVFCGVWWLLPLLLENFENAKTSLFN